MKASVSIVAVITLLALAVFAMGAADPDRSRDAVMARLRARVASLEQRVEKLEKELRAGRPRPSRSVQRPQGIPRGPRLPEGWRKREFNGLPYYLVPLERGSTRPSPRTPRRGRR